MKPSYQIVDRKDNQDFARYLATNDNYPQIPKNLRYYPQERNPPPLILSCHHALNHAGLFLQAAYF